MDTILRSSARLAMAILFMVLLAAQARQPRLKAIAEAPPATAEIADIPPPATASSPLPLNAALPAPGEAPSRRQPILIALDGRLDQLIEEIGSTYLPLPESREVLIENHPAMRELQALGSQAVPRIVARMTPGNRGRLILALGLFDHADAAEALDNLWIDPAEPYFPGG